MEKIVSKITRRLKFCARFSISYLLAVFTDKWKDGKLPVVAYSPSLGCKLHVEPTAGDMIRSVSGITGRRSIQVKNANLVTWATGTTMGTNCILLYRALTSLCRQLTITLPEFSEKLWSVLHCILDVQILYESIKLLTATILVAKKLAW